MNDSEIDIIARVPGKHKPIMMIEVKASIRESLQPSQSELGAYENTAKEHGIPLVYIIPKNYIHKSKLPKETKDNPKLKVRIITWEEIKETMEKNEMKITISFDSQIEQFVETCSDKNDLTNEEKELLKNKELLRNIFDFKKIRLEEIQEVLKTKKRKLSSEEPYEDQWGVGFYYSYNRNDFFIGFNPDYKKDDDKEFFFALCLAETKKNYELGDRELKPLFFNEGYYFIPIINKKIEDKEIDNVVLDSVLKKVVEKNIRSIDKQIREDFALFFALQTKIGKEEFEEIFESEKKYKDLKKRYKID